MFQSVALLLWMWIIHIKEGNQACQKKETEMSLLNMIHDFPALSVYEGKTLFGPNDRLYIKGSSSYELYDVMTYALSNGKCPLAAYARSIERGENPYWLQQTGTCIHNGPYTKYHAFLVEPGQIITYAGKQFKIVPANNSNYDLVEVAA